MDRDTAVQISVAALAVVLFVAGLAVLSVLFGSSTDQGGVELSTSGSMAIVGLIAVFVVAMPLVGYGLQQYQSDD
jgi:hypothetical protein